MIEVDTPSAILCPSPLVRRLSECLPDTPPAGLFSLRSRHCSLLRSGLPTKDALTFSIRRLLCPWCHSSAQHQEATAGVCRMDTGIHSFGKYLGLCLLCARHGQGDIKVSQAHQHSFHGSPARFPNTPGLSCLVLLSRLGGRSKRRDTQSQEPGTNQKDNSFLRALPADFHVHLIGQKRVTWSP